MVGRWQQWGFPGGRLTATHRRFCGACVGSVLCTVLTCMIYREEPQQQQQRVDDLFDNVLHARKGAAARGGAPQQRGRSQSLAFGGRKTK